MNRCTNCLNLETAETNTFLKNGVCSVCNQIKYKKKIDWKNRKKNLLDILNNHKNKSSYDCIVPFSGGKDSTFVLWYLTKKIGLKVLAVRYNHGFLRSTLNENVERVIKKLSVDFIDFKSKFDLVKKVMMESLLRRGDFCWHCHVGISAFPINTAIEKNVPLLFYGEPPSEYSSFYDYKKIEELDVEKFNRISNLGINAEDMMQMLKDRYPDENFDKRDFDPFIFPSQREIIKKNIKALYLGNFVPWDVKKQVEIIKTELGWRGDNVEGIPPSYDYEKIECFMQGSRDYIKYLKRGFGRTNHLASIDIRNKRISRSEGLNLEKQYDGKKPKSLNILLKILKITEEKFNTIVKKHVIYPHKFPKKIDTEKRNVFNEEFENIEKRIE